MKIADTKILFAYYRAMQFRKLIKIGEHLLKSQPQNPQLLNILGLAYDQHAIRRSALRKRSEYQKKAVSYFRKLLRINPQSVQAFRGLGLIALHQNRFTEALAYYKKAYALNKKDASHFSSLGNVYRRTKNYKQALMWYRKCLTVRELRATAYLNIASLCEDQNLFALAKRYAHLALKYLKGLDDAYSIMMKKKAKIMLE